LTAQQLRATHADVRQEIDALLDEYTDAQVASLLNERGLRTGAGDASSRSASSGSASLTSSRTSRSGCSPPAG
jgi:hypothetical protein